MGVFRPSAVAPFSPAVRSLGETQAQTKSPAAGAAVKGNRDVMGFAPVTDGAAGAAVDASWQVLSNGAACTNDSQELHSARPAAAMPRGGDVDVVQFAPKRLDRVEVDPRTGGSSHGPGDRRHAGKGI